MQNIAAWSVYWALSPLNYVHDDHIAPLPQSVTWNSLIYTKNLQHNALSFSVNWWQIFASKRMYHCPDALGKEADVRCLPQLHHMDCPSKWSKIQSWWVSISKSMSPTDVNDVESFIPLIHELQVRNDTELGFLFDDMPVGLQNMKWAGAFSPSLQLALHHARTCFTGLTVTAQGVT